MKVSAILSKINSINTKGPSTSGLVSKTQYNFDEKDLEKNIKDVDNNIPNTSRLVKKIDLNVKITEI